MAFTFYDTATGEAIGSTNSGQDSACHCHPAKVKELAAIRCAQVLSKPGSKCQLVLPLGGSDVPGLLAVGVVAAFARSEADAVQENNRLKKWAQSVCDRISLMIAMPVQRRNQLDKVESSTLAWQALVTLEQLARRLRIHKDTVKHQKRILRAASELVRVEAMIWVPEQADSDVVAWGRISLSTYDLRQLAHRLSKSPDLVKSGLLLANDLKETSWGACWPTISNLIACMIREHGANGLLIAINKFQALAHEPGQNRRQSSEPVAVKGPSSPLAMPFQRGDALALAPFAAMFGLHAGASCRYHDLKELLVGMTRSLTGAIDAKDSYTFGHSERVGRIAVELGRTMNLSEDELSDLYLAGLMHDIGKIGIRDAVLCKPGPLTPEEMEHLKQHVTIGHAMLANLHPIRHLLPGVLYHHERYDGAGYPVGLKEECIPILARILAVADAYDAMTTTRPYRIAMTHERAGEILKEGAGAQWDKQIVEAFFRCREKIRIIRQRGVGESLRQAIDGAMRGKGSSRHLGSISLVEPMR